VAKDLSKHLEGAVGAILITVGDTDKDGKVGVRAHVFGDIPFDGEDKPVGLLSSPEYEPADAGTLLGTVKEATKWATGVLSKIPFLPTRQTARRANARGRVLSPKAKTAKKRTAKAAPTPPAAE